MTHTLWILALFAACADAGRYDSHEMHNAKQEFCHKGGQLAVAAREHPDLAQTLIDDNNKRRSLDAKAWNEAMLVGLLASPDVSDRDLHMRGWSACMDAMKHR